MSVISRLVSQPLDTRFLSYPCLGIHLQLVRFGTRDACFEGTSGGSVTTEVSIEGRVTVDSSPDMRRTLSSALRSKPRSEEHTSELQSQSNLVCRLLLEKKKEKQSYTHRRLIR